MTKEELIENLFDYIHLKEILTLIIAIILMYILFRFIKRKIIRKIKRNKLIRIITGSLMWAIFIVFLLNIIARFMPENILASYETATTIENNNLFYYLISTSFIAPVFEETVFRYSICKLINRFIKKNTDMIFIIFSSIIFALCHGNLIQISYAFASGIILSKLYLYV